MGIAGIHSEHAFLVMLILIGWDWPAYCCVRTDPRSEAIARILVVNGHAMVLYFRHVVLGMGGCYAAVSSLHVAWGACGVVGLPSY